MKVDSPYYFPEINFVEDELEVEKATVPVSTKPKSVLLPVLAVGLLAFISLPFVAMAALQLAVGSQPTSSRIEVAQAGTPPTEALQPMGSATVAGAAAPAAAPVYIYWNYNFDAAKQLAIASNKSMMIDFYIDDDTCRTIDTTVYSQPQITAEAQNIVPLKISAEGQPDLAKRYSVTKFPTIIWTDAMGTEKYRQVGVDSVDQLLAAMQHFR